MGIAMPASMREVRRILTLRETARVTLQAAIRTLGGFGSEFGRSDGDGRGVMGLRQEVTMVVMTLASMIFLRYSSSWRPRLTRQRIVASLTRIRWEKIGELVGSSASEGVRQARLRRSARSLMAPES